MNPKTDDELVLDMENGGGMPRLTIELVTGEVEISGWDRPQMVFGSSELDEESDFDDLFALRRNGNDVAVSVNHGGGASHKKHQPRDEWDLDAMIRMSANAMRGVAADLQVKVPYACDVEVRTASGDIEIKHVDGKVSASSASGSLSMDDVQGSVLVKSASGDIEITQFSGRLGVRTMSGDIEVQAGDIDGLSIGTASGDVSISGRLTEDGEYEIQTVSGDVSLMMPDNTRCLAEIQTISGDIHCSLSHERQKSGKRRQKLAINGGAGATVRLSTTSGDIDLGEWEGAPHMRHKRPALTQRLENPGPGEQARAEGNSGGGETIRMDAQPNRASAEMSILQAIEHGEMSVEEGLRRLNALSQGF